MVLESVVGSLKTFSHQSSGRHI